MQFNIAELLTLIVDQNRALATIKNSLCWIRKFCINKQV